MKSLCKTFLLTVVVSLLVVSCSKDKASEVLNDAKIKTAETVGAAVEKELKEAYVGVVVEGVDCNEEAVEAGAYTSDKIKDFLKVKEEQMLSSRSAIGSLVPIVCEYVVSDIFPELISKVDTKYKCMVAAGSAKITKVGSDLCASIDL